MIAFILFTYVNWPYSVSKVHLYRKESALVYTPVEM